MMAARGMNTMPTARRGRTYYKQGANDNRGLGGACSVILVCLLLLVPPLILFGAESARHTRYIALSDALNSDIVELNHGVSAKELKHLRPGTLVHGTATNVDTLAADPDMGVALPGALTLRRNTEYCQWQELQSQRCETCTRTVKAKDGSNKTESYQCNCVKQYDYVKAWRNYRINSLLFDQPGAHHNPQRDPMPSRTFVGEDAKLTFREGIIAESLQDGAKRKQGGSVEARLDPDMLSSGVRNQPYRSVDFTLGGHTPPPSFFARIFSFLGPVRRTRYESLNMLRDTTDAPAAIHDRFVYVGQGGYFFSPHESATSSKLFNYFAQYLEGSLFDYQIGDLMPSCTAGDVRFYYEVQDPTVVSVLGQQGNGQANALQIAPRTMNGIGDERAATIGLVHAGAHSAQAMLIAEDSDSKNRAHAVRALLFLWSIPASRLAGVAFGRELGESSFLVQMEGILGLFLTLLGSTWLVVWGESYGATETTMLFFLGGTLGFLAYKSAARKGAGRRWHAVWCRIAKWANAPPEWRVEDSYVAPVEKVGGGSKMS